MKFRLKRAIKLNREMEKALLAYVRSKSNLLDTADEVFNYKGFSPQSLREAVEVAEYVARAAGCYEFERKKRKKRVESAGAHRVVGSRGSTATTTATRKNARSDEQP